MSMPGWKKWLIAAQIPFFTAVLVPGLLGAAVAYHHTGTVSAGLLILTLAGLCLAHAGSNMNNDYYDFTSGNDFHITPGPFNGGSGVIIGQLIAPQAVRRASLACYAAACAVGLLLACLRGWPVLIFLTLGLAGGYFYSADPLRLAHRTLGEVLVGLNFGPLIVLGSYYVQTREMSWTPLLASLPVGLLIAAVLLINEYPDQEADRRVGKITGVVRWGPALCLWGYCGLLAGSYLVVGAQARLGLMPSSAWLVLVTLPLGFWAGLLLQRHYQHPQELVLASALTILLHLTVGLALGASFLVA